MHIPTRIFPIVLALCVGRAPRAGAQEVRGIVFVASSEADGTAILDPVANLLADGFMAPGDGLDADSAGAFNQRWMASGRRYDLLSRGERINGVTLTGVEEGGCSESIARGRFDVRGTLSEGWEGLAVEGLSEQRDAPWLRDATSAERRELDRMAAALFDAHGIYIAGRTQGDTATAALIGHPNARPVLVASYALATVDALSRQAALLVIAEDGQDGYRPAYTWFHDAWEGDVESRVLVDAADLDGDGQAELVIRNGYYESWSYTILQRTPAGWVEAYHGGGGGC
jgi:hypothetical protein